MSQRTTTEARARATRRNAQSTGANAGARGSAPRRPGERGDGHSASLSTPASGRPNYGARIRYRFDLTLSKGSGALILWLALVSGVFVLITGTALMFVARYAHVDDDANSLPESVWDALMRTLDPGTVTGDSTWPYRIAALLITFAGIFIFSTLIGLIASVIDRTIENLRKGRGIVAEKDHTLVLGWSEKLHTIISELRVANTNRRDPCIVVLAPRDRVEMEDEINARFGGSLALDLLTGRAAMGFIRGMTRTSRGNTRIVCRTGNPADPADLALVSPTAARSVVILSDDSPSPDAQTTKVLLGLMSFDRNLTSMNVTVELAHDDIAEALEEATAHEIRTVVSSDLIARITAQICRQAGMGAVFQQLLDFDGDEIYFTHDPKLAGASYGQAVLSYQESSVIGVCSEDGSVRLNPPMNTRLLETDQIVAISEDDDTLRVRELDGWDHSTGSHRSGEAEPLAPDHLLIIGWNENAPRVLQLLAVAASAGSTVDIVVDPALAEVTESMLPAVQDGVTVRLLHADTSRAAPIHRLLADREYERLVILGYRDALSHAEADARTLLSLVHARRTLGAGHRNEHASIVAELLDARSVQLGRVANPDDFVVSERLTSLLLAQLAENGALGQVFAELLDGTGVEITMRPLQDYVPGTSAHAAAVTWGDLVRSARERGESAIGYIIPPAIDSHGVVINPNKSAPIDTEHASQLIVIA